MHLGLDHVSGTRSLEFHIDSSRAVHMNLTTTISAKDIMSRYHGHLYLLDGSEDCNVVIRFFIRDARRSENWKIFLISVKVNETIIRLTYSALLTSQ